MQIKFLTEFFHAGVTTEPVGYSGGLPPYMCLASQHLGGTFGAIYLSLHTKHSYVIPSEVEGPLKCGTRHPSRKDPSVRAGLAHRSG